MTETGSDPAKEPKSSTEQKSAPSSLLLGGSILAVILVVGIVISLVIFFRGGDEPLVPIGTADGVSNGTPADSDKFEDHPFFDSQNRLVYTPVTTEGVTLPQVGFSSSRDFTDAPGGVMLQLTHENMILPFSTTDGPTGFTAEGIATGFSRTAQGAGLAAAHYTSYLSGGNNRIESLKEAGLVEDRINSLDTQIKYNKTSGGAVNDIPTEVLPMVVVDFNPDVSRVFFGYTATQDGERKNFTTWAELAWTDSNGWIILIRDTNSVGGGILDSFDQDWASWW